MAKAYDKKVDSWAYRWTFSCWAQSGLTILPARNLVKNIGFGENATHTKKNDQQKSNLPLENLNFPLSYPSNIVRDYQADRWSDLNLFKISSINIWKNRFKKYFLSK